MGVTSIQNIFLFGFVNNSQLAVSQKIVIKIQIKLYPDSVAGCN